MALSNEEYLETQLWIMMIGALVRDMPLKAFIERAERGASLGPLLAPSHFIAGSEKLDLVIKLAKALHAFQAALPSMSEAMSMDEKAALLKERLGIE